MRDRECLLGKVVDDKMVLNDAGRIVQETWARIPHHFPHTMTDAFIVMPNHIHGIIEITDPVGATHASPLQRNGNAIPRGPKRGSLSAIVGSFKSASTRRVNALRGTTGSPFWQRNYYEHVIDGDDEMNRIREYIANNPYAWETDEDNPLCITTRR